MGSSVTSHTLSGKWALSKPKENGMDGPGIPRSLSRKIEGKMKTKRVKYYSQEQVEKQFQKHVTAIRKIRGFVNLNIKATVRVAHPTEPNKAVVLQSQHAV